jgi:thiamine biosynthesis lipoprotein
MRWNRIPRAMLVSANLIFLAGAISAETIPAVYKKRYAMGTLYEVVVYDRSVERASAAIDKALDEVVRLDEVMSNFKPESDLSRMNRSAHFHAVQIRSDLYKVIEASLNYSRLSEGAFDVSVGPVVDLWKAAMQGAPIPTAEEQARARACVGYEKIQLIPPDRIEFHSKCVRLDLGSIGKGYAVDRMAEILRAGGVASAYINAGGSTMYAIGTPPEREGWNVNLRDPSNKWDPRVELVDNSVSTSEQTAPSALQGDAPGHIVLPGSGKPLRTRYAVSVVARTATASDALSTMMLLLGPEKGERLVKRIPGAAAIWVSADGVKTIASTGPRIVLGSIAHTKMAEDATKNEMTLEKRN